MWEEYRKQKEDFLKSIQDFEAGNLPTFTKEQSIKHNRELRLSYLNLTRLQPPEDLYYLVTIGDVQQVQEEWLVYRDAWVKFGRVKYPNVPAHAWRAYFTMKRTAMLKELYEGWNLGDPKPR